MAEQPLFLVSDAQVVEALGLPVDGKARRDRYALQELRPGLGRLFQLAHDYGALEAKQRSTLQQQVVDLATNVDSVLDLSAAFDFARQQYAVGPGARLLAVTGGRTTLGFHEVVEQGGALMALSRELLALPSAEAAPDLASLSALLSAAQEAAARSAVLALFPPAGPPVDAEAWLTPADLLAAALAGTPPAAWQLAALEQCERLAADPTGPARTACLAQLAEGLRGAAGARGALAAADLERAYADADLLGWSLRAFGGAFLATILLWLAPRRRWPARIAAVGAGLGTGLLVAAIVMRCLIRGRPPVSTLYETVLFVSATGTLIALFVEWVDRRRLALSAAVLLGTAGLLLADGYELLDKRDTMPSLVAVLDTNFWLATHVTTITLGYGAGMLAALMASAWIVTRACGWKRAEPEVHRAWAATIYGVVAFSATAALVGTILGGIWANESWGRFWGWDPKENGALLIVLTQVGILHGRIGGFLRERGLCAAAAFGGTVIAFSWWGVNLLGVGLHSYGFTSGVQRALWIYYGVQWGIVALGLWDGWRAGRRGSRAALPAARGGAQAAVVRSGPRGAVRLATGDASTAGPPAVPAVEGALKTRPARSDKARGKGGKRRLSRRMAARIRARAPR